MYALFILEYSWVSTLRITFEQGFAQALSRARGTASMQAPLAKEIVLIKTIDPSPLISCQIQERSGTDT